MKSLLKRLNFSQKVVSCPQCGQSLRVPIKMGKTLRITCASCHCQFELAFTHPLASLFKWDKTQTASDNAYRLFRSFRQLPTQAKLTVALFLFSLIYVLSSFIMPVAAEQAPSVESVRPVQEQRRSWND